MTTVLTAGASAGGMAALSNLSARPTFELAFSQLQNALLDRLDEKLREFQKTEKNDVDVFLKLEQDKLKQMLPKVRTYGKEVIDTRTKLTEMLDNLDALEAESDAGDGAAFNTKLDALNRNLGLLRPPNGSELGIYYDGGVSEMQREGLGIDAWTNAGTATTQINTIREKVAIAIQVYNVKQEDASERFDKVTQRLQVLDLDIEGKRMIDKAAALDEVKQLKEQYGYILQAISTAFEVQQGANDAMFKRLSGNSYEPGSVLNLFT